MNSAIASLSKNLLLVGILVLSTLNYFYGWLNWKELIAVQSLVGLAYVFLSCYEYLNASYKASLPVQRFPYFSNSYLMFKVLKIGVFVAFAALLFLSSSSVKSLYPICLIIAGTEGAITYLKFKNSLCFVNIYANYLLFAEDKLSKLFASEILVVEFRHDIFYFVKKDQKSVQVKLEHIHNREEFIQSLQSWITRNNVPVSDESKGKLKQLLA